MNANDIAIIGLDHKHFFSEKICQALTRFLKKEVTLVDAEEMIFANKEIKVTIQESIRGKDVYIVHLFDEPLGQKSINDNIFTLACAAQSAYYSGAFRITGVIPQFPYARQDKKKGREPITAKIIGNLLESVGISHLITLDIHSEAIEGHFNNIRLENLHMGRLLIDYIQQNLKLENLMIVAPDIGSAKRGGFFAKKLNLPLAIVDKVRNYSQQSKITGMTLVGSVKDKDVIICDDMIATGGTIINACKLLKDNGAQNVYVAIALPYLSGNAIERLEKAHDEGYLKKIITSNAVHWGEKLNNTDWYETLDITDFFANAIHNLHSGLSLSDLLS